MSEKEYPDVLYDFGRYIKEAHDNNEPYIVLVMKPGKYFYGTHNPTDEAFPQWEPHMLRAAIHFANNRYRTAYLRGMVNNALDQHMLDNAEEAISDIEKRIAESTGDYDDIEEWGDDL